MLDSESINQLFTRSDSISRSWAMVVLFATLRLYKKFPGADGGWGGGEDKNI